MKYSVSLLLLLAFAASNCNGQMEAPGRGPASRPNVAPGNPNARPAPPPRGPTPNGGTPAVPPPRGDRPAPSPNAPATRPNPQQNPRAPPPPPPSGGRPAPPASRPNPQQNPPRVPPAPPSGNTATTRGPAVNNPPAAPNNPNRPQSTTAAGSTTRPTTTRPDTGPGVSNDPNVPTDRPDSFPTAPTIAPAPPVHFPDTNVPQMPNFPSGRMDARCPRTADPRNPVFLAHEANCNLYFRCGDNSFAMEQRCPEGQHWNAMRNICDFPGNAGCQSGAPVPRPQPMPPTNWNPPRNPHPGYEHPIVIPMAPRT